MTIFPRHWIALLVLVLLAALSAAETTPIRIASKPMTESAVLAEIAGGLARDQGFPVIRNKELGGNALWMGLLSGEIDLYPEYTGTLRREIFAGKNLSDDAALQRELQGLGLVITRSLGFDNRYALAVREDLARHLGLRRISDLPNHPELRFGFSSAFMDRADGWPSLRERYRLPQRDVRGMEHVLTYQALEKGEVDLIDAYTTDPHIAIDRLRLLEDDRGHFPRYDAVFLYRQALAASAPGLAQALSRLEGRIGAHEMLALNQQVEMDGLTEAETAAQFLAGTFGIQSDTKRPGWLERQWQRTREHLLLVAVSLSAAIPVAVPLGLLAARYSLAGHLIVGVAEIIQTIPGLALLVLLAVVFAPLHLPTIGAWPMIVALFLYSLLPIIRNTLAGIESVPKGVRESAIALGLTPFARLRLIELPLAAPLILTGIKTTAVINVGYATLGGLIGAGGYGQPIITGLRLHSSSLMLEGAIPAALMALLVKGLFAALERRLVPRGLRLSGRAGSNR